MASQGSLALIEDNDPQVTLTFALGGAPVDLTGLGIEFVLKDSADAADDDPTSIVLTLAAGDITVTNATGGIAVVEIAATHLAVPTDAAGRFWRCDLLDGTKRHTAGYGKLTVTNV